MSVSPVPSASIAGMGAAFVIALAASIAVFIYGRKKLHGRFTSSLFGAVVYYVVYKVLEPIVSATLIGFTGNLITGSLLMFSIFGALISALFEEGAKLLAMRTLIKDVTEEDAFMYGAGAGIFEAFLLTILPQVGNVLNSVLINSGIMEESLKMLEEPELTETYNAIVPLWETSSAAFWFAGFERIIMIAMCICLTLIMYYYIKRGDRRLLAFPFAAHFAVICISTLLSKNAGIAVSGIATLLMVAGIVYYTVTVRRSIHEPGSEYAAAPAAEDDHYLDL